MNINGANFRNLSATELIKSGNGLAFGVIVNSHTSGTMKLYDGIDDTAGVLATQTLTIAGGSLVPAVFATATLTSNNTNVSDGDTFTIGSQTYRFKTVPTQAYDIFIGASADASMTSALNAINGTGTVGVDYFAGTVAHPLVIAGTLSSHAFPITSRTIGTGNNSLATTKVATTLSWGGTTLGGAGNTAGVAVAGATFSINGVSYYFTTKLTETVLGAGNGVPNEILWVTNDAGALANMKKAINASGTEGTDYGTGTVANTDVTATTNSSTTQVIQAIRYGSSQNSLPVTSGMAHATWGASTLAGGTDASRLICNTFSFPTGSGVYKFPEPINFVNGLYFVVGGTLDCTVEFI